MYLILNNLHQEFLILLDTSSPVWRLNRPLDTRNYPWTSQMYPLKIFVAFLIPHRNVSSTHGHPIPMCGFLEELNLDLMRILLSRFFGVLRNSIMGVRWHITDFRERIFASSLVQFILAGKKNSLKVAGNQFLSWWGYRCVKNTLITKVQ